MPENLHETAGLPDASGDRREVFDTVVLTDGTSISSMLNISRTQSVPQEYGTVGTLVSNVTTKVAEGTKNMFNTFGGAGPFGKIGAKAETFGKYSADFMQAQFGEATSAVKNLFGRKDAYAVGATAVSAGLTTPRDGLTASAANSLNVGKGVPDARDHLFSLTSKQTGTIVEFFVMPEVVENRDVDYEAVAPVQFPGAFQKYKGTNSVVWTVNATLISRTSKEATQNLRDLNVLRGWTMPYFGENTAKAIPGKLGAPPDVLIFKGLREAMIGPVPVVIKSLNWNWPKDVDYIPAKKLFPQNDTTEGNNEALIPFPTVMQISLNLVESFSTTEFNNFDLKDYREGNLIDAYRKSITFKEAGRNIAQEDAINIDDTFEG